MPRVILKPTEEERKQVKLLAAVGTNPQDIARLFHVSESTLQKYYREELFRGPLEAKARVDQTFLHLASSGKDPRATIAWVNRDDLRVSQGRAAHRAEIPDFIVASEKKAA